jgi:hypothetical protein
MMPGSLILHIVETILAQSCGADSYYWNPMLSGVRLFAAIAVSCVKMSFSLKVQAFL